MEILVDVDTDPDMWNSVCWFAIISFKSLFLHSGLLLNICWDRIFIFFSLMMYWIGFVSHIYTPAMLMMARTN